MLDDIWVSANIESESDTEIPEQEEITRKHPLFIEKFDVFKITISHNFIPKLNYTAIKQISGHYFNHISFLSFQMQFLFVF